MCQFIETIKIWNGMPFLLDYHQERFDRARAAYFSVANKILLKDEIVVPISLSEEKLLKCRVIYGPKIESIEYLTYVPARVRSLKMIACDDVSYDHKYHDRRRLERLVQQKGQYDDILIIKNGLVTDTSFSNVVFKNRKGEWITPESFLLKGVKRQFLLNNKMITKERITGSDIKKYKSIKLINAMLDIEGSYEIPIEMVG